MDSLLIFLMTLGPVFALPLLYYCCQNGPGSRRGGGGDGDGGGDFGGGGDGGGGGGCDGGG